MRLPLIGNVPDSVLLLGAALFMASRGGAAPPAPAIVPGDVVMSQRVAAATSAPSSAIGQVVTHVHSLAPAGTRWQELRSGGQIIGWMLAPVSSPAMLEV